MINNKSRLTMYDKYGVENISQSEEFVNIIRPDKYSQVYADFNKNINDKVVNAMRWLAERNIEYSWNEIINGHLYRLCIISKNILFDFEFYPTMNTEYNYIRINYDTDIILTLEKLYPEHILDTKQLETYVLNQKASNEFFRQNNASPMYDDNVLRLAFVKDSEIYQCIGIKGDKIIKNVTKKKCAVNWGTYMMLRYLNEYYDIPQIYIKDSLDNSFTTTMYQLAKLSVIKQSAKRKIWWSADQTKWHITSEERNNYMPFYHTELITYCYSSVPGTGGMI